MSEDDETLWRRVPGALQRCTRTSVVLLPPDASEAVVLRGEAFEIWDLLDRPRCVPPLLTPLLDGLEARGAIERCR